MKKLSLFAVVLVIGAAATQAQAGFYSWHSDKKPPPPQEQPQQESYGTWFSWLTAHFQK